MMAEKDLQSTVRSIRASIARIAWSIRKIRKGGGHGR